MDPGLLRLRRHHHSLLLSPFSDVGGLCRDFLNGPPESLGRDDQASTASGLIAHLVVSHIARQSSAASTLGFSSYWWSRQCVICTLQACIELRIVLRLVFRRH